MSTTLAHHLAHILDRDLGHLEGQIDAYASDEDLWRVADGIQNSGGTLAVHLAGNLEHFVGAVLGGTGFVRDRVAEFGERGLPRAEVRARVERCRVRVAEALSGLDDESMMRPYPGTLPGPLAGASTHLFLVHLAVHLTWHLGQMDYHRRLLSA